MDNDKKENDEPSYLDSLESELLQDEKLQHLIGGLLDPDPTPTPEETAPKMPAWAQAPNQTLAAPAQPDPDPEPEPTGRTWRVMLEMLWIYLGNKLANPERHVARMVNHFKFVNLPRGDDLMTWIAITFMTVVIATFLFWVLATLYTSHFTG